MIHLEEVDEDNWREPLAVSEEQRRFVANTTTQLARAWAYRNSGSRARMIYDDDTPVGMLLYYDWDEEKQYVFSQLLIDRRYQRRGFGRRAAELALDEMRADGKYSKVCLCYVEGDEPARQIYETLGFVPTGVVEGNEIIMELEAL